MLRMGLDVVIFTVRSGHCLVEPGTSQTLFLTALTLHHQAFEALVLVEELRVPVFELVEQILFSSSIVAGADSILDQNVVFARYHFS